MLDSLGERVFEALVPDGALPADPFDDIGWLTPFGEPVEVRILDTKRIPDPLWRDEHFPPVFGSAYRTFDLRQRVHGREL